MLWYLIKTTFKLVFWTAAVCAVVVLVPGLPPYETLLVTEFDTLRELTGPLKKNNLLDKAEVVVGDEIRGAEAIAVDDKGTVYFPAIGGGIYKFEGGKLKKITQTGEDCDRVWEENKCGLPLGIRLDKENQLWVADAYKGILKINPDTGKKETVVKFGQDIEGTTVKFPDDLDIASDGSIYWSEAVSIQDCSEWFTDLISQSPSGRLIRTDPKTGKSTVLARDILFANGVQLSPDEDFVLVAETGRMKVMRYHLRGSKKGTFDVFVDRLPGFPDNIRCNGKGGFYISIVGSFDDRLVTLGRFPIVRKLIIRLYYVVSVPVRFLGKYFPENSVLRLMKDGLRNLIFHEGAKALVVETDVNGNIIGSLHADKAPINGISTAIAAGPYVYLGSPFNTKVWRVKL